ncbi:hypothetical protein DUNSADRAFT_4249 [Dunaliella salina]|uniref:Uncharacterized protein n=1 Tax=Dunaliella salina TaxID=3046 RepID=A0ABQ7GSA8_DUNSA|nr:hypothetical protein DUNSADRAFT_4249 [Dunaliella salina]|eukprot:KAF5837502.1 hypothetical protein DUNSADRAFT_4249 [Dunaliella salina]
MEESIDHELTSMVDTFGNLLKAARVPDDEAEALAVRERKDRAPGDLLEVWAEKLVRSGHTALGLVSQLKRGALLSDFESLIARSGDIVHNAAWQLKLV